MERGGSWCDIVLIIHALTEYKIVNMKDSFCKELQCVVDKFPKYHMKILVGHFSAEGMKDILKSTIGNESLHEINNENGVRTVNFASSKNLIAKITMFPHRNIHKFTLVSPDRLAIKLTIF
jgi:hypothetical protein